MLDDHPIESFDYIALAGKMIHYRLLLTKRYPLFSIKDFLYENEVFWKPYGVNKEDINYAEVMKDYIKPGICGYDLEVTDRIITQSELRTIRKDQISEFLNADKDKIIFIDHHSCHAHHAYFSSPLRGEDVLVITMDGSGDGVNATASIINQEGNIKELYRTSKCNLARVYQYTTQLLGMKPMEHEYKVMGLAAYTKEKYIEEPLKIFKEMYYVDGLEFKCDQDIQNHYEYLKERLEGYRFDSIAGALQRYVEDLVIEWVLNWLEHTNTNKVVFSGGVALNIKLSKKIAELDEVEDMFVCLGGGDESLCIGAAQNLHIEKTKENNLQPIGSAYLGSGYSKGDIEIAINHPIIKNGFEVTRDINYSEVAKILASGDVVALIQKGMEFGPRALGHRSLIADPSNKDVVQKINETIKNRDFWMPFTPSILDERMDDYIINPKNLQAPYMTMAFDSTDLAKTELIAAIHPYDLTVRPQRVKKEVEESYHQLISAFEAITGIGAVLNTSLNIHGKPIVRTPEQFIEEVLTVPGVNLNHILIDKILLSRK